MRLKEKIGKDGFIYFKKVKIRRKEKAGFELFKKYGPNSGATSEEVSWAALPKKARKFWRTVADLFEGQIL